MCFPEPEAFRFKGSRKDDELRDPKDEGDPVTSPSPIQESNRREPKEDEQARLLNFTYFLGGRL